MRAVVRKLTNRRDVASVPIPKFATVPAAKSRNHANFGFSALVQNHPARLG